MRWLLPFISPVLTLAASIGTVTFDINEQTAGWAGANLAGGTFNIDSNSLTFTGSDFDNFAGGSFQLKDAEIRAIPGTRRLEMTGGCILEDPQTAYIGGDLFMENMDLRYGDWVIGTAHVRIQQSPPPHLLGGSGCPTNFGPGPNVSLTALNNLQTWAYQTNVRVALSFDTQIKNIGAVDVPWFWAINPPGPIEPIIGQHPYLILNFYRLLNGVLEQIGRSDAKHAFFSTNSDCPCAGAQVIFVNCTDTYSANNNANQFYFAPRSEITAHTAAWTSSGSHFDGTPADNFRSHTNESAFGTSSNFVHRLVVQHADLQFTSAQYFVEAWYVVQNDTNIFDSMGYRRVTPTNNGATWTFTFNTTLITGPAINAWAAYTNVALDTGEGHLQLATTTTNLTNGLVRYRYALANHDFDRQIKNFSVPLLSNIAATNLVFYDGDTNAANDWVASVTNQSVSWQTPTTNGLDWGVLYSFVFDANAPPQNGSATLGILESTNSETLTASTRVPFAPAASLPTPTQITWSVISGSVYQLQAASDMASDWFNVNDPVTAQSPNLSLVDTNDSSTQRYFRVLQSP